LLQKLTWISHFISNNFLVNQKVTKTGKFNSPVRAVVIFHKLKQNQKKKLQHGFYYSAEFIFSHFPGQNESLSLSNLFTRNTNVGFQSLAITIETKATEQM